MALTTSGLRGLRLQNQWIGVPRSGKAAAVVDHLVAVQAQDYSGAKWSLGLRLKQATDASVEEEFNGGKILRTHVLRPTWHFVRPADLRWLLMLTGPRVQAQNAGMYRQAGMGAALLRRSDAILQRALEENGPMGRDELRTALTAGRIAMDHEFRFTYALMHAELEGLICSGPRHGKQFTYALLDRRAPATRRLSREEALAQLAWRYFRSRGPATVHDMAKWSGLTVAECRAGLEAVKARMRRDLLDGKEYWYAEPAGKRGGERVTAHLLSVFDEYLSSYRGLGLIAREGWNERLRGFGNALTGVIEINGELAGTWSRRAGRQSIQLELRPFKALDRRERDAIERALASYEKFHGMKIEVMRQKPPELK